MENEYVGDIVPVEAAEEEGLQVAVTAEAEKDGNGDGGDERLMAVAVVNGGEDVGVTVKRKRGRPRKQLGEIRQEVTENSGGQQKRGRGRPRGSGKWQTLASSLGLSGGEIPGSNFTPYILHIQAGENIVDRIWSFCQNTQDSMCILSACGTVSSAEILQPTAQSGIVRYEGQFTLLVLNGSHLYHEKRGHKHRLLSVKLSTSDGRFVGGALGSSLIAATPTMIVISTFKQKFRASSISIGDPNPNPNENGAVAVVPPLMQPENGRVSDNTTPAAAQPQPQPQPQHAFNATLPSTSHPADWNSFRLPSSNT